MGLGVVVSRDGSFACVVDAAVVSVVGLPSLERLAEVGVGEGSDIAVVRDRVIVLARDGVLHVVDPLGREGPEKVGELQLDPGSRILAVSGEHMIVALAASAGVVALSGTPVLWRLPSRLAVGAAGPAVAPDHFILVVGGALEEWSAITRSPLRRFRLDKPVAARSVGGGARHVWFAPDSEPDTVVTIPLVGAARTQIALGEPASKIAVDPTGMFIAALGAQTGGLSIAGLGERATSTLHPGRIDSFAWRGASSIVCTSGTVIELVDVARGGAAASAPVSTNGEREDTSEAPLERTMSTGERLAAWKDRAARRDLDAPSDEIEVVTTRATDYSGESVPIHEWRDVIANWTRRQLAGSRGEPPLLAAGPLYDVGLRLGIAAENSPFLWMIYGARLCGIDGVPPVELVPLTAQRWEEALGRGKLAVTGAFAWRRSRVHLVPEIVAALDEVAPLFGTVAPAAVPPRVTDGTVALVAPANIELGAIAAWAAPHVGSLLVPNARGLRAPGRLMLEARARGLVPLLPAQRLPRHEVPTQPAAIVVEAAAAAIELRVPIALSWSTTST
jgi:hypothetical protein